MQALQKKRDLQKLYQPPPEQDYSSNYTRLIIVILISACFIGGQILAGIWAGSIAIISDAIHLISDVIGFFFSFLFLYLSKLQPNEKMTFGYHRMELLGAIANIFIIWILIFFVVYQSTQRIINKSFVQKPMIMLIAAGAGLLVNIVLYKVLHGGANHSHGLLADSCDHDHQHGHYHGHQHGHQHGHGHGHETGSQHGNSRDKKSPKRGRAQSARQRSSETGEIDCSDENFPCIEDICKDEDCNLSVQAIHCHKNADVHKHSGKKDHQPIRLPLLGHKHSEDCTHEHADVIKTIEINVNKKKQLKQGQQMCQIEHQHNGNCYLSSKKQIKKIQHVCNGQHHQGHHHQDKNGAHKHSQQHSQQHKHTKSCNHQQQHKHQVKHQHQHNGKCTHSQQKHNHQPHQHDHTGCKGHQHDHHEHDHGNEQEEQGDSRNQSIGMQAAILHALSDMIMSVGLIISSLIIFFLGNPNGYTEEVTQWNAWHLFDPLATYLFSIVSLASTLPVVKNAYYLLMETTPTYIKISELKRKFEAVDGVIDVHDIHVWDLKPGKTLLIAHILASTDMERRVLIELSDIARKSKIFHSTFQVEEEEWKDQESYILCRHDIH